MKKSLPIYYKNQYAGELTRHESGEFTFDYDEDYKNSSSPSLSSTLPKAQGSFFSERFFPFFDGLIPEGWILNLSAQKLKLDAFKDRFELFEALCYDCIGAVYHAKNPTEKIQKREIFKEGTWPKTRERCLSCYEKLGDSRLGNYHQLCLKGFFDQFEEKNPLVFNSAKLEELAEKDLNKRLSIPGVQKKVSFEYGEGPKGKGIRATLSSLSGRFILKPASEAPHLAENEDLCLKLAKSSGLKVADSLLIEDDRGNLCLLSKRFDRNKNGERFHQEDFSQIFEKYPYEKYTGSHEKIAAFLKNHAEIPGDDVFRFFEIVIFNYLIGNADAHLKNFTFCCEKRQTLSPIYDTLSTDLYIKDDPEKSALTINGKKSNHKRQDFFKFAKTIGISEKVFTRVLEKFQRDFYEWKTLIDKSFLAEEKKKHFKSIIENRLHTLVKG